MHLLVEADNKVALARGSVEVLVGDGPVLAFLRTNGAERVLVVHNLGDVAKTTAVTVTAAGTEVLYATPGVALTPQVASITVVTPAHGSALVRLQ